MSQSYSLFEVFGIELEYMVVDQKTLDVKPIVDQVFTDICGKPSNVVNGNGVDWSNELVAHVVELKNSPPHHAPFQLIENFQGEVRRANQILQKYGAQLMPGAVHPWMNPDKETRLWPYENNSIYSAYDRIFGCKGHGWSNLQSLHINISFATDQEFRLLHSAIRGILPLIPVLSASSPFLEGADSGYASRRLSFYLQNQKRIPSIIGEAIPDVALSQEDYENKILKPMYKDIAPFDPAGDLQEEWLNSRGAIPKFERGCVEIRLADVQESCHIDIAIASFWIDLLKSWVIDSKLDVQRIDQISSRELRSLLEKTIRDGEKAVIDHKEYLALFGLEKPLTASELLTGLSAGLGHQPWSETLTKLLRIGSLSTRMRKALPTGAFDRSDLSGICQELCQSLEKGKFFEA